MKLKWETLKELAERKTQIRTITGKPFHIARATETALTIEVGSGRRHTIQRINLEKAAAILGEGTIINGPKDYAIKVCDEGSSYAFAILKELGYVS